MKIHTKKKATRAAWKKLAKDGFMNEASGAWRPRSGFADTSMKRDFSPQVGK